MEIQELGEAQGKAAEQDDDRALIHLGDCYENGWGGVSKDHDEAVRWHKKAVEVIRKEAEQGNASKQHELARYYYAGSHGLMHSYTDAAKWYRKATDQGYAYAQFRLASLYEAGEGVPKDFAEAFCWHLKAAEKGNVPARLRLSERYFEGNGVERDLIEAYKWVRLAIDNDKSGIWHRKLAPVRALLTEEQIAEAEARCREFYSLRRSASQNESHIL
jgi:TPR repeat protein